MTSPFFHPKEKKRRQRRSKDRSARRTALLSSSQQQVQLVCWLCLVSNYFSAEVVLPVACGFCLPPPANEDAFRCGGTGRATVADASTRAEPCRLWRGRETVGMSAFLVGATTRTSRIVGTAAAERSRFRPTRLSAAKRSGGGVGGRKKRGKDPGLGRRGKVKKNTSPKKKNSRGGGKAGKAKFSFGQQQQQQQQPTTVAASTLTDVIDGPTGSKAAAGRKKSASAPPWQVLSTKDAKKNVEKEIRRRDLTRRGVIATHEEVPAPGGLDGDGSSSSSKASVVYSTAFLEDTDRKFINWKRFNPSTSPASMRLVGSYLGSRTLPPRFGVPEVSFLGRSNVGKSSLLNRLSSSAGGGGGGSGSAVARVGKTPGATATVNLYVLADAKGRDLIGFADLPGFGYAKLSKEAKESVQEAAENYLNRRKELALGVLLVDIRRIPSDDDRAVLAALYDMGVPLVVVATKADKITSESKREESLEKIRDRLGLPDGQPLTVSSANGKGCRKLWQIILQACETSVDDFKAKYDDKVAADSSDREETSTSSAGSRGEAATTGIEGSDFDDEEFVYDQGYDWIHADGIMYEDDEEDFLSGSDEDEDYYEDEAGETRVKLVEEPLSGPTTERETLRSLKKRARGMEKRGEV